MTIADLREGEYREELATRLQRLGVVGAALLAVVLLGYGYIQLVRGGHYRELAEHNRLREAPITAPRGLIGDVAGRILVENIPSYNLLFDRQQAAAADSLWVAAAVLGMAVEELEARARASSGPAPALLAEGLDLTQVARIEAESLEHPEFRIEVQQRRLYRHGEQTAHVVGYLSEAAQRDVEGSGGSIRPGDLVGREGVEQQFDGRLRGADGRQVLIVDSRGRTIEQARREPAAPGHDLHLTVDLALQQRAQLEMGDRVGAVVALDPRSGAVRALYSSPSFDPNLFARRLARDEWQALIDAEHQPLQNRALESAYPPGSVFKIVLALAGLEQPGFDPAHRVFCGGSLRIYDRARRCWDRNGHGWMDLHAAIRQSCDIYFYTKGQELGIETIARYARLLGLGEATGIDLPGEKRGLVPDSAWSRRVRNAPWYPGETISVAIGQGPLLTTPLQIAVLVSAVANGGYRVTPHLADEDARTPTALPLQERSLERVQRALEAVVNEPRGSGRNAALPGITVAGKTGTAQVVEQKTWTRSESLQYAHRDHAWFASYAPAERPELAVVVFVEHGGLGSQAAAPIARALYESYFDLDRGAR
ncbi:MAG TPA: penicillin-binding protein 2 [Thermoanaerobaculia bacterium]|nr:penicillin-binding protein 2 [Thermoanaerobaculia bacterium]